MLWAKGTTGLPPQPDQQLATVLRAMRDQEYARTILIEKERLQRLDRRRREGPRDEDLRKQRDATAHPTEGQTAQAAQFRHRIHAPRLRVRDWASPPSSTAAAVRSRPW